MKTNVPVDFSFNHVEKIEDLLKFFNNEIKNIKVKCSVDNDLKRKILSFNGHESIGIFEMELNNNKEKTIYLLRSEVSLMLEKERKLFLTFILQTIQTFYTITDNYTYMDKGKNIDFTSYKHIDFELDKCPFFSIETDDATRTDYFKRELEPEFYYKSRIYAEKWLDTINSLSSTVKEFIDNPDTMKLETIKTPTLTKDNTTKDKQGTARQLALAFNLMVKAGHLPKGITDSSGNARFIEFMTGKGFENVRKELGKIKHNEYPVKTEREYQSLINDYITLKNVFDDVLFTEESNDIDKKLTTLNNDLKSLQSD